MKVTQNSTYRLMQTNLERITTKLQDLQTQGATGRKLNTPSDSPASIGPVISTRTQISNTDRYLNTMGVASDGMKSTDGYLASVENVLQQAKTITNNAINASLNDADRATLADQIKQLKQQLLDSSNASVNGKYIFAGYEEDTKPFTENASYDPATYDPTNPATWPVQYNGDANAVNLEITPGEYTQTNITGNELFLGISQTSWDSATYTRGSGQIDIFHVLSQTEDAIRAGNVDDPTGPGGGMQANLTDLETSADQERILRSRLGSRATRVDAAITQQQSVKVDLQQILSRYQDADSIATFNDLTQQQTAFQAALKITSQVSSISILNYLQ